MKDDLKRIAEQDDELARLLVKSKDLDMPGPELHSKIFSAMQRAGTLEEPVVSSIADENPPRPSRRIVWYSGAAAALLLAAALALQITRRAEPRTPVAATSASAAALPAVSASAPPPARSLSFPPCKDPLPLSGTQLLIDDFEEPTPRTWLDKTVSGVWQNHNDRTGQNPPPGPIHPSPLKPRRAGSRHALHVVGGAHTSWGMSASLVIDELRCIDASKFAGIEFWIRGTGRLKFAVRTVQVQAKEFGGTCTQGCYDGHSKILTLTKGWQHYQFAWGDLAQQGYGTKVPFDVRSVMAVDFAVGPEDTPYDFWVDDVKFLPLR